MKPAPFDYVAARSVDHAVELLDGADDARVIAGGQSLMPVLNMRLGRPDRVVDIGRLDELDRVAVDDGGRLVVGAGVTQARLLDDPRVADRWPLLTAALAHIGHPQIRNRGTVCGSLAHNDPAAELPAAAIVLDATMHVRSATGDRSVAADDMFVGPFTTALDSGDLLVAVAFPAQPDGAGWSFREFATRPGDFATAGVAVRLVRRGDVVGDARIALFGVEGAAARVAAVEGALVGSTPAAAAGEVRTQLGASIDPVDDVHASAQLRRDLADTLLVDALAEAWERCR